MPKSVDEQAQNIVDVVFNGILTPQERERLMQEHRHMMHQHMQAMKDGGMMGGDAKSGSGMGTGKEQKDGEKHK